MFTVERTRRENKLLMDSCPRATEMDSCPQTTRENSWRQQPRELRQKHKKKNDTHPKKTTVDRQKYAKGNVNKEQHRHSDKSHGTMGRQ